MSLFIAIAAGVTVALPLWYSWRVWELDEPTRAAWAAGVAEAALIVTLVLVVGRWDIAGLYTRWVLLAAFAAAVFRSSWRVARSPGRRGPAPLPRLVSVALLAFALGYVLLGLRPPSDPVELAFPLKDGRFVVGQGGGNRLLNHHSPHPAQRHAADITAVGRAGFRAVRPLPADPTRYAVWGAPVVSPCDAEVTAARGDLPDLAPPQSDPEHPAGNHVVLDCGGVVVELAHLMQGSVTVAAGDSIATGEPVGRVGNSGNTTEPHLHIHAVDPDTDAGVPMSLDGRVPLRNRVYRK